MHSTHDVWCDHEEFSSNRCLHNRWKGDRSQGSGNKAPQTAWQAQRGTWTCSNRRNECMRCFWEGAASRGPPVSDSLPEDSMSQPGTTVLLPLLQPSSGQSPMEAELPLKSHLSLLAETQTSAPGTGHPDRPVDFCCLPPGVGAHSAATATPCHYLGFKGRPWELCALGGKHRLCSQTELGSNSSLYYLLPIQWVTVNYIVSSLFGQIN